jgi:hypothetical protein
MFLHSKKCEVKEKIEVSKKYWWKETQLFLHENTATSNTDCPVNKESYVGDIVLYIPYHVVELNK